MSDFDLKEKPIAVSENQYKEDEDRKRAWKKGEEPAKTEEESTREFLNRDYRVRALTASVQDSAIRARRSSKRTLCV